MLVMAVRLARKLPQTLVLPTEVSMRRVYVGVKSHDVKAILAQLRKAPCVTVQVKVTTSHGHTAVLPSYSTLDTNVTSAAARKVVCVYRSGLGGHLDWSKHLSLIRITLSTVVSKVVALTVTFDDEQ